MVPRWLSGLFLLLAGGALLSGVWRSLKTGEISAGSTFFQAYRYTRDDEPLGFYALAAMYGGIGLALCIWGLAQIVGLAPAISWR